MSHDRGCWKCGEDPSEYVRCNRPDCPKRDQVQVFGLDAAIALANRPVGKHPALAAPYGTRPTCHSCGRSQPLWGNCFRLASECPVRAAFASGRPATQIISVKEPGYEIMLFLNPDGGAQAVISRPGGKEPIDVLIAPPIPGRRIVVERKGDTFDVSYKDAQ